MDVLLVDDSKTMRMLVQRAIRQAGYRTLVFGEAENGVHALAMLQKEKPKLILSDWNMPEMSGIELLRNLRTGGNRTPFGFITSESSLEIKDLAITNGADFLLTKPFNPEDVQSARSSPGGLLTMAEPKPLTIAQLFTNLTGRTVNFTQVLKPPITKTKQAYGTYLIKPTETMRVLQLDLPLLGSFGGSLLGIPSETVKERLMSPGTDEPLRDAMHEILNVASTIISIENRAIFQYMFLEAVPDMILESLKSPAYRSYFEVNISGYEGGAFSIFAPI